jgi:excisionase family DNA binding protein
LTVKEAAQRARVSEVTILRECRGKTPRLRCVRVGGRRAIRIRMEWVDLWLERQTPEWAEAQRATTK